METVSKFDLNGSRLLAILLLVRWYSEEKGYVTLCYAMLELCLSISRDDRGLIRGLAKLLAVSVYFGFAQVILTVH